MSSLLGPNGQPISAFKKDKAPPMGPAFGQWSGREERMFQMPGGSIMNFDLSALTLNDFRMMKEHPTINSSLSVLTFMLHQVDWHIECEDQKIADMVQSNMERIWTRLVRAMSTSFWAGYSPNVLEFENNPITGYIEITKVKDLVPEECEVNWKQVEGSYAPPDRMKPKFYVYDGINQFGGPFPIPPENTFWYPIFMENGNYWGRKLLKAAFMPWYFSLLMHLFANRYFERFGEPTIYGRAPFDEDVTMPDGTVKSGRDVMEGILTGLRNRSVVVLPSERDPAVTSAGANRAYTWEIDYLESQMRGADFERYMSRLDEEMSLALFTPLLLLRNADVGSHNLGVQHTQTWLWMLNAITGDMAEYINRYITNRLKGLNFTPNAPDCRWVPKKMGKESVETLRAVVVELMKAGRAKPDLDELGQALGMTLTEIKQVITDEDDPNADPTDDRQRVERDRGSDGPRGVGEPRATGREIAARIQAQVEKAFKENKFGPGFTPTPGYRKRFEQSLVAEGATAQRAEVLTLGFYERLESWFQTTVELGADEYAGPSDYMALFNRKLDRELDLLLEGVSV